MPEWMSEWECPATLPRLRGIVYNPEAQKTLIALHGWLDNAASFAFLAKKLPEWKWIAVDFPGHGKSEHNPKGVPYHYSDYIFALKEVLDALSEKNATLLGHSLGATVAAIFAGTFPDYVRQMVLIEGISPILELQPQNAPLNLAKHILCRQRDPEPNSKPSFKKLEDAVKLRVKATPMSEEGAAALMERNLEQGKAGCRWVSDRRLRAPSAVYFNREQVRCFLERIQAPVLGIRALPGMGEVGDPMQDLLHAIPEFTLKEIAGGHHVHCDHPEEVAALIRPFLNE